jgi:serine/threonine-protein kinase
MIKTGMMIGDRYEILEKIGTGGMSDVYKAKDIKLNRSVAVKVLKQEFSENENFVSKFRVEAQAAAGLEHPNIVNIYDVGEENGIYYIIMEVVEGITLKDYIEKKARLSVKEAISIAIQVSMGIQAAHGNKIIHRDIKPQNIMISTSGKVKVTDFGIAKAATSNTITSNVMGSVHYTSPEQARGGYSDEKSDIYSLGITLFEMLTGRVPFNGETTVAIAIKHIQEEMPSPRDFVPEIPISVEQIVFKCTGKSPDRRYQSVEEVIADLKRSLMNPDEPFVKVVDTQADEATRKISNDELNSIKKQMNEQVYPEDSIRTLDKKANRSRTSKKKNLDDDIRKERWITAAIVIVTIIIGLGIILFVGNAVGFFGDGDEQVSDIQLIDIDGMTWDEAKIALDEASILYNEPTYMESLSVPVGEVISATYKEGDMIISSDKISIVVSSGTQGIMVPDVIGMLESDASEALEAKGLDVVVEEEYSEAVTKGYVISQTPEGDHVLPGSEEVKLVVSAGKEEAMGTIPVLLGLTEAEAKQVIEDAGFAVNVGASIESSQYGNGQVGFQSPTAGGEAAIGTEIKIRISEGVNYNVNYTVVAPVDYISGEATVILTTDDGEELYRDTTTGFPVEIHINGITTATEGTVTVIYNVSVAENYIDEFGNTQTRTTQKAQTEIIPIVFEQG